MMNSANPQRSRNIYISDAILSATPAQLLTMLYDRLMLDLNRAEAAQAGQNWAAASEQLLHAQAIVAELTSSLKVDAWEGGEGLLGLYNYVSTALVNANINRDVNRTRESIALLEPLRLAWHEAAGQLPAQASPAAAVVPEGSGESRSLGVA